MTRGPTPDGGPRLRVDRDWGDTDAAGPDKVARLSEGLARLVATEGVEGGVTTDREGGGRDQAAVIGELMFSLGNVARTLGVDPESI